MRRSRYLLVASTSLLLVTIHSSESDMRDLAKSDGASDVVINVLHLRRSAKSCSKIPSPRLDFHFFAEVGSDLRATKYPALLLLERLYRSL